MLAEFPEVVVVEDDHAGDIASAPPVSLGRHLPARTVHVAQLLQEPRARPAAGRGRRAGRRDRRAVADRRLLGPGWSSRLLQAVLLDLLTDPAAAAQVATARDAYAPRRAALLEPPADRGVSATADDGINLWMAVDDQQIAMVELAAHGIAVAPGAPFCVTPLPAATTSGSPPVWSPTASTSWPTCSRRPPSGTAAAAAPEPARTRAAGADPRRRIHHER